MLKWKVIFNKSELISYQVNVCFLQDKKNIKLILNVLYFRGNRHALSRFVIDFLSEVEHTLNTISHVIIFFWKTCYMLQ